MHCVVGSGPSGVACARALLRRGLTVQLVDGGFQLEPARAQTIREMAGTAPESWRPEHLALLRHGVTAGPGGIPLKRAYGSDFPYRRADGTAAGYPDIGLRPSLARGGLSNVWGAAMLPYRAADLAGWPFGPERLADHYRAAVALTGIAAEHDDLEPEFPLYAEQPDVLTPSRQGAAMLATLARHRDALRSAGITFGRARLAVKGRRARTNDGCRYCGQCLYGCPYGCIYNSLNTLRALERDRAFSYRPDFIVDAVRETSDGVVVSGRDRHSGSETAFACDRVFLAAGPLDSSRLLLQALDAFDVPVSLRDSQYFVVPLITPRATPRVRDEALHTLSQLFLELSDPTLSPYTIHLQIYTYNDIVSQAVAGAFGAMRRPFDFLIRQMEGRLLVAQGYLHSHHSAAIELTLRRTARADQPALAVRAMHNPATRPLITNVLRTLLRHSRRLGAAPIPPLLRVGLPGQGYHTGGSFPMRGRPGPFETDVLGRPPGLKRIHAVDATIFPTVPATTITLTVMANAHRVAWETTGADAFGLA